MHCLGSGTRVKKVLVVGVQVGAGAPRAAPHIWRRPPRSCAPQATTRIPPPRPPSPTPHLTTPVKTVKRGQPQIKVYSVAVYVEGERAAKELGIRSRGGFFENDGDYCAALLDGAFGKALVVGFLGWIVMVGGVVRVGCCVLAEAERQRQGWLLCGLVPKSND
jgi:hypothetical protein